MPVINIPEPDDQARGNEPVKQARLLQRLTSDKQDALNASIASAAFDVAAGAVVPVVIVAI